ncbi:hypothetical protein [Noviherbaspirillum sp. UKPF54]|uniref:hypothetical protein n=1 Tax=Noviherbaspirillum sp. UKPF54 TaxID=2601898 RepID=UPI0011B10135|nr:hypothetical protein [Noviherbaspirillum sp. UKPF54]QDZ27312.1 hypothetical protein FAY22_04700 [Noviherbaspirillum sp. UKPF54]
MTRPENLFEAASYDLNKFRERRIAERRSQPRNGPDRRASQSTARTTPAIDGNAGDNGKVDG